MYVAFRGEDGGESVIFSDQADQRLYRQDLRPAGDGARRRRAGRRSRPARWSAPRPITPAPPAARAHRYADGRVTPDGRAAGQRARAARGRRRGGQRTRQPAHRRVGRAPRRSPPATTSTPRRGSARTVGASPGSAGTTRACRGTARSCGRRSSPATAASPASGSSPAARRSRSCSRSGAPPASSGSPATAPAGGTCTRSRRRPAPPRARALPAAPRATPSSPSVPWVFGLQHYVFLDDGSLRRQLHRGRPRPPRRARRADRRGDRGPRRQSPCASSTRPTRVVYSLAPLGDRVGLIAATHTEGLQVVVVDPRDRRRRGRPPRPAGARSTRRTSAARSRSCSPRRAASRRTPTTTRRRTRTSSRPTGELPPLLVNVHGGPTSAHEAMLDLDVQYWTSRGIAVVDVNYGGSTGYGREYRERLRGRVGRRRHRRLHQRRAGTSIARGDADPARVGVRGGSAGGYTTLNALTRFDFFSAGASLFGLADLETFATGGTHKFESRYLDSLRRAVSGAARRLPRALAHPPRRRPQLPGDPAPGPGGRDRPADQADIIVEALRRKGLPFAYLAFEGEQHGFRKAENIIRAEEAELYFYGRVWGFTPADEIEPVAIENLRRSGGGRRRCALRPRRRRGAPAVRGVYSDAMRIRTISLVALGWPASSPPSRHRGARVLRLLDRHGRVRRRRQSRRSSRSTSATASGRKAQMDDYSKRHYSSTPTCSPTPRRSSSTTPRGPPGRAPGTPSTPTPPTTTRSRASRRSSSSTRTAPSIS